MLLIGYGGREVTGQIHKFRAWGPIFHKILGFLTLATVIGLYFNIDTLLLSHLLPDNFLLPTGLKKNCLKKKALHL